MSKIVRPLLALLALMFFVGCASTIPHVIVPDYGKRGIALIAVMPVKNVSSDPKSSEMLRDKLVEELYFKGYPNIPLKMIDEKLAGVYGESGEPPSPQLVGEMLKVDAVLYPTLNESRMGRGMIYASTVADAEFQLRSAKTGEVLWQVRYRAVYRHYDVTRRRLELKASRIYEQAIREVVTRALETLPDGPDALGS
jgi:hypothetical protein